MKPLRDDYYVYIYLDPRKPGKWFTDVATFLFEPIYVGEGRESRMYSHTNEKILETDSNKLKTNKLKKIIREGHKPVCFKIYEDLMPDDGLSKEASLIRQIGTICTIYTVPRGPLTNAQLREGRKYIPSQESIDKMIETKANRPPEIKLEYFKRKSDSMKKAWSDPIVKDMRSDALKRGMRNRSDEQKQAHIEAKRKGLLSRSKEQLERERLEKRARYEAKSDEYKKNLYDRRCRALSKMQLILTSYGMIIEVEYLHGWCEEHNVNYSSLRNTKIRGGFFKGFHLLGDTNEIQF